MLTKRFIFFTPSNNEFLLGIEPDEESDPSQKILFFKKKLAKLTALLGKVDGNVSDDENDLTFEFPLKTEEQMESLEARVKDDMALQYKLVCFFLLF